MPVIIIVLVAGAWALRWENNGQQGNKSYHYDRWLSQGWVKVISPTAFYEAPVIAQDILLLEKDRQVVILGLVDKISNNHAVMARNIEKADGFQDYEKKGLDLYSYVKYGSREPSSLSDYEKQAIRDYMAASGKVSANRELSSTYRELKTSFDAYWNAHNNNIQLQNMAQEQAARILSQKAVEKRRIASIGSLTIGLVALSGLIYLYLSAGKQKPKLTEEA